MEIKTIHAPRYLSGWFDKEVNKELEEGWILIERRTEIENEKGIIFIAELAKMDEAQEGYGCEEKDRCCNFECEYCEISPRQYLQITGKKPSNKNITDLINGLKILNETLEEDNLVPFEEYEVIKF